MFVSAPIAFLICCRGCEIVEGFTSYLTNVLRKNGINATSDLFERNEFQEKGIAVVLENKLKLADYVILVCTEGESSSSRVILLSLKNG